jgi:hypothetical protein
MTDLKARFCATGLEEFDCEGLLTLDLPPFSYGYSTYKGVPLVAYIVA